MTTPIKKLVKEITLLTPPDFHCCQAEKSNGVTFMTCGGRREMKRCTNKAYVLATEREPGIDGQTGSMTVCGECFVEMQRQYCQICHGSAARMDQVWRPFRKEEWPSADGRSVRMESLFCRLLIQKVVLVWETFFAERLHRLVRLKKICF